MSDTGPVCSCGTATIENPCPRHPSVEKKQVPNRRIELKVETVLQAMGYETVRFEGHVAIVNQPTRVVNLVSLFAQLLEQADDLIEAMRPLLEEALENHETDTGAEYEQLELVAKDLMQWGNPPKIEMPVKKASRKARKKP